MYEMVAVGIQQPSSIETEKKETMGGRDSAVEESDEALANKEKQTS